MEQDQKLVNGIRALLGDAGYGDIVTQQDGNNMLLTARRGNGMVTLHIAAEATTKRRRVEETSVQAHDVRESGIVVPGIDGVVEQLRANPELAKAMNIPDAHLKQIL